MKSLCAGLVLLALLAVIETPSKAKGNCVTTYGPFYPTSVVNVANGGVAWDIEDGEAEAVITGEGTTDFLEATGFNTSLPSGAVVKQVRLVIDPDLNQLGFNNSDQFIVGPMGEQQAYAVPPAIRAEDGDVTGLTRANVLDPAFGFKFSIYAQNGGTVNVASLALYVDVE